MIDLQNSAASYEYADNNLTKILENNKAKMRYAYDSRHNVVKAVTQTQDDSGNDVGNVVYEFKYDDYGNNTLVNVVHAENAISTAAAYTSDGNRILASTITVPLSRLLLKKERDCNRPGASCQGRRSGNAKTCVIDRVRRGIVHRVQLYPESCALTGLALDGPPRFPFPTSGGAQIFDIM